MRPNQAKRSPSGLSAIDRTADLRAGEPCRDRATAAWVDGVEDGSPVEIRRHRSNQACVSQQQQVPSGRRSTEADLLRQRRRPARAECERSNDLPAERVREEFDAGSVAFGHVSNGQHPSGRSTGDLRGLDARLAGRRPIVSLEWTFPRIALEGKEFVRAGGRPSLGYGTLRPMDLDLTDRRFLVTGGSRGLGRGSREGAGGRWRAVVLVARSRMRCGRPPRRWRARRSTPTCRRRTVPGPPSTPQSEALGGLDGTPGQ